VMYSWTWVYSAAYTATFFLVFGRYLPNSSGEASGGYGGLVFLTLIVRVPNLFIYFRTAKRDGHGKACMKILRIELIALLIGTGLAILFSLMVIFL
jgi:hypothetical protein